VRDVAARRDVGSVGDLAGPEISDQPQLLRLAQVSGAAEPAGWPSTKPIEAVVGSEP